MCLIVRWCCTEWPWGISGAEVRKLLSKISFFLSDFYLIDLLKKTVSMATGWGAQHRWRERWTLEDAAFVSVCWDEWIGCRIPVRSQRERERERERPVIWTQTSTWCKLKACSIISPLIHDVHVTLAAHLLCFIQPSVYCFSFFHPSIFFFQSFHFFLFSFFHWSDSFLLSFIHPSVHLFSFLPSINR